MVTIVLLDVVVVVLVVIAWDVFKVAALEVQDFALDLDMGSAVGFDVVLEHGFVEDLAVVSVIIFVVMIFIEDRDEIVIVVVVFPNAVVCPHEDEILFNDDLTVVVFDWGVVPLSVVGVRRVALVDSVVLVCL